MSDPTSIFNSTTPPVTPDPNGGSNTPNAQIDPALTTMLMEIKNERGEPKYKTMQDAIIALKHSQDYIPQLNQKLNQANEELTTLKTAVGRMEELERTVQALTQRNEPGSTTPQQVVTEEQIAELVTKTLTRTQQETVAKANLKKVVDALSQKFGAEAEKVFYGKAGDLGMTAQEMNALAAKTPVAVLKLLGLENTNTPANTGAPTTTTVNTSGFQPTSNSLIGKNPKSALIGATTQELRQESDNARRMVEELHAQGKTIHDLTDPKVYFKHFN